MNFETQTIINDSKGKNHTRNGSRFTSENNEATMCTDEKGGSGIPKRMAKEKGIRSGTVKVPKQSPLKQIRKFCLACVGESRKSILCCCDTGCSLWYLRLGKHPRTAIRESRGRYGEIFKKENFEEEAIFCPHKHISEYRI